jgi:hypothetical protein
MLVLITFASDTHFGLADIGQRELDENRTKDGQMVGRHECRQHHHYGTSFCGRKINCEPTAYNYDVHLLLQNQHGGTGELGYMTLDNKSVMAIH